MYTYNARVLKVIDGDTVDLEIDLGFHVKVTKRARLSGIDTYEKNSRLVFERELAAKATSYLTNIIQNKIVKIRTQIDKEDKYGRILVEIYSTDLDFENHNSINLQLIQEGLAMKYDGGKKNV